MKLIIHDLSQEQFETLGIVIDADTKMIADDGTIKACIGCFGCWIKTPGRCALKDNYHNMGMLLGKSDEFVVISRCNYGCYSPFVKNVLDRSIPFILPYFTTINGETHHQRRYRRQIAFVVHFYGEDITLAECQTAKALVRANSINLHMTVSDIRFHKSIQDMREVFC
ncbi:flavodoxin family protein [Lachnospiraceae bacterium ZAX-1]